MKAYEGEMVIPVRIMARNKVAALNLVQAAARGIVNQGDLVYLWAESGSVSKLTYHAADRIAPRNRAPKVSVKEV